MLGRDSSAFSDLLRFELDAYKLNLVAEKRDAFNLLAFSPVPTCNLAGRECADKSETFHAYHQVRGLEEPMGGQLTAIDRKSVV